MLALQWCNVFDCVADLTCESFPADLGGEQVLYWHGVDKGNRKICKLCCCRMFCQSDFHHR